MYHGCALISAVDPAEENLARVEVVDGISVGVKDTEGWRIVVILVAVPKGVALFEQLAGD
jgi:hypothetical protein